MITNLYTNYIKLYGGPRTLYTRHVRNKDPISTYETKRHYFYSEDIYVTYKTNQSRINCDDPSVFDYITHNNINYIDANDGLRPDGWGEMVDDGVLSFGKIQKLSTMSRLTSTTYIFGLCSPSKNHYKKTDNFCLWL